jgi:DTW domain-containing protein YfiP
MSRLTCYRCFWPQSLCWCASITPMPSRTRFVFLMHPKEFKHEKAGTGRLTHLCLGNSEIHMGLNFDTAEAVQELIADPANFPVLVYPGTTARNLTTGALAPAELGGRRLVLFLLDGTWSGARKMLRLSPSLQKLPRVMFTPTAPSRFLIKQQPQDGCLSTLETAHELLLALTASGLDTYALPAQLLDLFARMQAFQMKCAADPALAGYRRRAFRTPEQRVLSPNRRRYIPTPVEPPTL